MHQLNFSANLFANRKKAQNLFFNAINEGIYVDLYGIIGQGKTQFLGWIMHDAAKSNKYLGVYIDFSQTELHDGEFIRLLRMVSEQIYHKEVFATDPFSFFNAKTGGKLPKILNDDVETDLIEEFHTEFYYVLISHKVLLCLDNIEEGNLLVQKFEKEVLRYHLNMPNLMLVSAGQKPMRWETFTLRERVEPYPLECLDKEGTQDKIQRLYESRGIEMNLEKEVDISKLFKLTQGHPLSIDRLLALWTNKLTGNWRLETTEEQYKQGIELLIKEVIESRILKNLQLGSDYPLPIEILRRVAFLRHIQRKVQRRVLAGFVSGIFQESPFFSDYLLIQFQKAHILNWKEDVGGYVLHPLIRGILLEEMRLTSKKEFVEIQTELVSIYGELVKESKDNTSVRIINFIEMLYHRAVLLTEEPAKKDEMNKLIEKDVQNYLGRSLASGPAQQRSELDGLRSRLENDQELRELIDMEPLLDLLANSGKKIRNAA